jgi:hypothetical protein
MTESKSTKKFSGLPPPGWCFQHAQLGEKPTTCEVSRPALRMVAGKDDEAIERRINKSDVFLSDFELIPRRKVKHKRKVKVATAREYAAMEFTPWKLDHPPGQPGPSNETM